MAASELSAPKEATSTHKKKNVKKNNPCCSSQEAETTGVIKTALLQEKEEQIVGTWEKSQWIDTRGVSRTYNTQMQLSRLQRIYHFRKLTYN